MELFQIPSRNYQGDAKIHTHHLVKFPANMRRTPPRLPEDRQPGYEDRFDYETMFSDAFIVNEGLELLGPPLLNTRESVLGADFHIDGKQFTGEITSEDKHRISRTILQGVKAADSVELSIEGNATRIKVNKPFRDFDGLNVLVTQQKDNPIEWIGYWIEYHIRHHGINGALIYDNMSSIYTPEELKAGLQHIQGLHTLVIIPWNVPFGVTGGPNQVWDSDFGQHQGLEHAMRYMLVNARCVIQQDVDELLLAESGKSVCDTIVESEVAELRYPRRQILQLPYASVAPEDERGFRLHSDYAYFRQESPYLAGKYACVPSRAPASSHYLAHGIDGTTRIISDDFLARHFGGIRIEWRAGEESPVNNISREAVQQKISVDSPLLESFRSIGIATHHKSTRTSPEFAVPLSEAGAGGSLAPVRNITSLEELSDHPAGTVSRWRYVDASGQSLDFLTYRGSSDLLVSSFHGALDRKRYAVPRFERLATLSSLSCSSVYFSDPNLGLHDELELAWFQGGPGTHILSTAAQICRRLQCAFAARSTIHTGSSGGGFAALRVSAKMPDSVAVVFNPQTSIGAYLAGGSSYASQRSYVKYVWPDLFERIDGRVEDLPSFEDATSVETSALADYRQPLANRVVYCNNRNDFHVQDHYLPFLQAAATGDNLRNISVFEYDGPEGHTPPSPDQFLEGIQRGIALSGR